MKELETYFDTHKSFYKKAFYIEHAHGATLYSYGTKILELVYVGNDTYIRKIWNGYSATTQRHINEFVKQFAYKFDSNKKWFENLPNEFVIIK